MSGAPSLAELQRWMRWVLTHPAGVEQALGGAAVPALPTRFHPPLPDCLPQVVGEETRGRQPKHRLAVYANGYFSRLHGALQVEFPGVEEALGPALFRDVVAQHLLEHPSRSPSLADLGAGLDATLRLLPLATGLPWVADLAALERALAEVWLGDAQAPAPLVLPPGVDPATLALGLPPTVRLVRTDWTVDRWREDRDQLREARRWLLVWREEARVGTMPLAAASFGMLEALAAGATLGEGCAVADRLGATPEEVLADFEAWSRRGWLELRSPGGGAGAPPGRRP